MESCELAVTIALALIIIFGAISTVFLVMVLIKVRKVAVEFEKALHKINSELDVVSRMSSKVVSLTEKISSPLVSAVSIIFYALSGINKRKKQTEEENERK
jgi:uncharacterized protein YoxC